MSDKPAKPAIPSWQRVTPSTSPPSPGAEDSTRDEPQSASESQEEEPETSKTTSESPTLLEQASRFLEEPTIRDAPRDRKAAFLESKGVSQENIEKLLGAAEQNTPPSVQTAEQQSWPKTSTAPKSQPRDIPPIVTYPEFLTQSAKPPPLITARRIATIAYITGAVATALYGLSQYIVAPMTDTLTDARHDFAEHAQTHVEDFNTRLGSIVSVDPATTTKPLKPTDHSDEISEADSDPTELYHRDYGTQTTPSLSRRASVSSSTAASDPEANSTTARHEKDLKHLTSCLQELQATQSNDTSSTDSLRTQLTELNTYLSEMTYQSYSSYSTGMYGGTNYGVPRAKDGTVDQVEALKAEIRGVKGVLLSARNFPAGGGRVRSLVGATEG